MRDDRQIGAAIVAVLAGLPDYQPMLKRVLLQRVRVILGGCTRDDFAAGFDWITQRGLVVRITAAETGHAARARLTGRGRKLVARQQRPPAPR